MSDDPNWLDELRRLETRATKAPWVLWCGEGPDHKGVEKYSVCHHLPLLPSGAPDYGRDESHACVATAIGKHDEEAAANAAFIAAARVGVPRLLARLEALERVRSVLTDIAYDGYDTMGDVRGAARCALRTLDAAEAEAGKEWGGGDE